MRLGILQCDELREEFRPEFDDFPKMISDGLSRARPDWQFVVFRCHRGEFPTTLSDCDAFITTGSQMSVYDEDEWIGELATLVRDIAEKRVSFVGICFGHQMMAHALGGKVEPASVGWGVGVHTTRRLDHESQTVALPDELRLIVSHQDQVTVPAPGTTILGGSELCPVSWCEHGDTMLGIQGHPEFSKRYSRALMELRRDQIGEQVVAEGIQSLSQDVDAELAFELITRFIERANLMVRDS